MNRHLRLQDNVEEVPRPQVLVACSVAGVAVVRLGSAVHRSTVFCVWVSVVLISSPSWLDRSEDYGGGCHAAAARRVAHCRAPPRRFAGGDGSLAVAAAAALEGGLPFVCVPAGTRNHFAFDLGVDRHDLVGSLDAFIDGVERRIDVAEVNGRLFLNNVSLGIYGDAVRRPTYRDAKARTLLEPGAHVLGPSAAAVDLRLVDNQGRPGLNPAVVLVSKNPYSLEPRMQPARGRRSTADSSGSSSGRPRAGTDMGRRATRGDRARAGPRRSGRRGGQANPAARVRHPTRW